MAVVESQLIVTEFCKVRHQPATEDESV